MGNHRGQQVGTAIAKSLTFLRRAQLPKGEFRVLAAKDQAMKCGCHHDSSPFVTSLILYSLRFAHGNEKREMIAKGLRFLCSQAMEIGLWRYWSKNHELHATLPPDIDDTANASFVLELYDHPFLANREIVYTSKNEEGLFYTWFLPRGAFPERFKQALSSVVSPEAMLKLAVFNAFDDVDPYINANVALYLGENENTTRAIEYLVGLVAGNRSQVNSRSYLNVLAFYYFLSRAYFCSVPSLQRIGKTIINMLETLHDSAGSFGNALHTALAVCTYHNLRVAGPMMDKPISRILEGQKNDGSWPRIPLYVGPAPYYGSEELTTAFCLEALCRYAPVPRQ